MMIRQKICLDNDMMISIPSGRGGKLKVLSGKCRCLGGNFYPESGLVDIHPTVFLRLEPLETSRKCFILLEYPDKVDGNQTAFYFDDDVAVELEAFCERPYIKLAINGSNFFPKDLVAMYLSNFFFSHNHYRDEVNRNTSKKGQGPVFRQKHLIDDKNKVGIAYIDLDPVSNGTLSIRLIKKVQLKLSDFPEKVIFYGSRFVEDLELYLKDCDILLSYYEFELSNIYPNVIIRFPDSRKCYLSQLACERLVNRCSSNNKRKMNDSIGSNSTRKRPIQQHLEIIEFDEGRVILNKKTNYFRKPLDDFLRLEYPPMIYTEIFKWNQFVIATSLDHLDILVDIMYLLRNSIVLLAHEKKFVKNLKEHSRKTSAVSGYPLIINQYPECDDIYCFGRLINIDANSKEFLIASPLQLASSTSDDGNFVNLMYYGPLFATDNSKTFDASLELKESHLQATVSNNKKIALRDKQKIGHA